MRHVPQVVDVCGVGMSEHTFDSLGFTRAVDISSVIKLKASKAAGLYVQLCTVTE